MNRKAKKKKKKSKWKLKMSDYDVLAVLVCFCFFFKNVFGLLVFQDKREPEAEGDDIKSAYDVFMGGKSVGGSGGGSGGSKGSKKKNAPEPELFIEIDL